MGHDQALFFQEFVESAYGSLENPDFAFVKRGFSSRPYDPVIKRLRDYAVVEELTEADDDVCFSYLLKGRAALWKLDLSLVGRFGLFARLKARPGREDMLAAGRTDLVDFEVKMIDILKTGGVRVLGSEELATPMPLSLFNTPRDAVRVYQAFFSDRPKLPWEA